jgi:nitrite reductase/ring-hydroxylating ferredoxin subunit
MMLRLLPQEARKRQDGKEVHAMLNQCAHPQLTFPRAMDERIGITL